MLFGLMSFHVIDQSRETSFPALRRDAIALDASLGLWFTRPTLPELVVGPDGSPFGVV